MLMNPVQAAAITWHALRSRDHPLLAQIVVTRRCNLSCAYCNEYDHHSAPVPLPLLRERVGHLARLKTLMVAPSGGEPLLQLDANAIEALHAAGFEVGVETNGTIAAPPGIDWLCVSPKGNAPLQQRSGDELKLVYPQVECEAQPERFETLAFTHLYLQPLDDTERDANTRAAVDYCLAHPRWQLSLQTHKLLGID